MTTKYTLVLGGIRDNESGAFMPDGYNGYLLDQYNQWLSDGNTPDSEIVEMTRQRALNQVRDITMSAILTKYPDHKQRNMISRAVEIMHLGNSATTEETAEFNQIKAIWDSIKAARVVCNAKLVEIEAADTIDDINDTLATFSAPEII